MSLEGTPDGPGRHDLPSVGDFHSREAREPAARSGCPVREPDVVKSRHRETSGVPVTIAVLGFLVFAAYWAWRLSILNEVVEWVVVGGAIFLLSVVFYLKRRR